MTLCRIVEPATPWREVFRDAVGYWEAGRVPYNLVLSAVVVAWLGYAWPHVRLAMALASVPPVAALANICYSAAYLLDVPIQRTKLRMFWRRWRGTLWLVAMLAAMLLTYCWVANDYGR